jgi:SAM-dependent methyltransferase
VSLSVTHPSLLGLEMGSPGWFEAQREMIRSKPLIKRCYDLWYQHLLADAMSVAPKSQGGLLVELGSGSGYFKDLCPELITSDVVEGVADRVIDGRKLPFQDGTVRALFLTHTFHHIPDIEAFLREADRVLVPGGVISMIECANTPFAKFFFSKIHPEPFREDAPDWTFPQTHSMLDSNQALSWIVFFRDRKRFEALYPGFEVGTPKLLPWLSYLLSGGVNLRSLIPNRFARVGVLLDRAFSSLDSLFALHWHLTVRKKSV